MTCEICVQNDGNENLRHESHCDSKDSESPESKQSRPSAPWKPFSIKVRRRKVPCGRLGCTLLHSATAKALDRFHGLLLQPKGLQINRSKSSETENKMIFRGSTFQKSLQSVTNFLKISLPPEGVGVA